VKSVVVPGKLLVGHLFDEKKLQFRSKTNYNRYTTQNVDSTNILLASLKKYIFLIRLWITVHDAYKLLQHSWAGVKTVDRGRGAGFIFIAIFSFITCGLATHEACFSGHPTST